MSAKNKRNKKNNYIEEMKEWQEHKYDPGYFMGGKTPIFLTGPRKPNIIGISYIISGIVLIIFTMYIIITYYSDNDIASIILFFILCTGIGIIYILAGFRLMKKAKLNKKNKKNYSH